MRLKHVRSCFENALWGCSRRGRGSRKGPVGSRQIRRSSHEILTPLTQPSLTAPRALRCASRRWRPVSRPPPPPAPSSGTAQNAASPATSALRQRGLQAPRGAARALARAAASSSASSPPKSAGAPRTAAASPSIWEAVRVDGGGVSARRRGPKRRQAGGPEDRKTLRAPPAASRRIGKQPGARCPRRCRSGAGPR